MKKVSLIFMVIFALIGGAFAQTTPAGTQIQNQASATYLDSAGNPQTANSNLAITVVQAVYGFSITPNGTEAAPGQTQNQVPGSTVNFKWVITNNGNNADSITLSTLQGTSDNFDFGSPTIYEDLNGNGSVDAGEPIITTPLALTAGQTKNLVVSGVVPGTATPAQTGNLDLTGVSVGDNTKTDSGNFARATVINDANPTLSKLASAPVLNGTSGLYEITYGLTGSNTGNLPAKSRPSVITLAAAQDGILISDTIPAGTSYVAGSATGGAGATGTTSVVYFNGTVWSTTEPAAVTRVGLLMRDATPAGNNSNDTLNVGATYNLSFKVSIPAATAGGTVFTNVATLDFRNNNGTTNNTTTSNTTTTTAPTLKATAIGPSGQPVGVASGTATYTDPISGVLFTYNRSGNGAATPTPTDQETVLTATTGTTVTFVNTVRNTGNTTDIFTISHDSSNILNNLPAGYSVALFQSDGVTPLSSGVTLASGADYTVVVRITIPATAVISATANITAIIKSTSSSNSDITRDIIVAITSGQSVDIRNNDNSTGTVPPAGTTNASASQTTNPGTVVNYPLTVTNTGTVDDNYALTATGLPSGSTVQFYVDTNGDGLPDGAPITNTALLNTTDIVQLVAVVTVPANAAPVLNAPITFIATSNSNPSGATDSIVNTLTINAVNALVLSPDRSSNIPSPGTVVYAHTLSNNGNSSASVTLSPAASGTAGFSYLIYHDVNNNGSVDAGDILLYNGTSSTAVNVAANSSIPVLVQVSAASGLVDNTTDARQITAVGNFAGPPAGSATSVVTDTTKIVVGKLDLQKTASTATASPRTAPGVLAAASEITYTIVATNLGSGALSNVIIFDPIPAYTDLKLNGATTVTVTNCPVGATCAVEYSTNNGSTWTTTLPTDTNANGYSDEATRVTNIRVVVTGLTVGTTVNAFPAGAAITIVFTVSVR